MQRRKTRATHALTSNLSFFLCFFLCAANPPVFLVTSLPHSEASRRSAEYVRMPPAQAKISRLHGERSQSFSSYSPPTFDPAVRQAALGSISAGALGPPAAVKRPPIVYPALLSRVANAFVQRITTSPRIKDSIEYKDCFDGRDAVVSANVTLDLLFIF